MARPRIDDLVRAYSDRQAYLLSDEREKLYAANELRSIADGFDPFTEYDIFLSHSYDDARVIKQLVDMLSEKEFKVYVDWLVDSQLSRASVDTTTATLLRSRMNHCRALVYVTSAAAEKSVWMPWELGYMDARTGLVAVAPLIGPDEEDDFAGREYLGLYPYLDLTGDDFYIHADHSSWVGFDGWMAGEKPGSHSS